MEKKALRATATGNNYGNTDSYAWYELFDWSETVDSFVYLSGDVNVSYDLPIDNLEDGSWTLKFNPYVHIGGT